MEDFQTFKARLLPKSQKQEIQEILDNYYLVFLEIIDFGLEIIWIDSNKKKVGSSEIVALLMLRKFIENIDAISVLIKNSIPVPSKSLLRSILELNFEFQYLISPPNYKFKSLAFLYYDIIRELKHVSEIRKENQSETKPKKKLRDLEYLSRKEMALKEKLKIEEFKEVKNFLEEKKVKSNEKWFFRFLTPNSNSYRDLAKSLNIEHEYIYGYKYFSQHVHSKGLMDVVSIESEHSKIQYEQFRYPGDAQFVTLQVIYLSTRFYESYINFRTPELKTKFLGLLEWLRPISKDLANRNIISRN